MSFAETKLSVILLGISQAFKVQARRDRAYRKRLAEKNLTAQIKVVDNSVGRYFTFKGGKVASKSGFIRRARCPTDRSPRLLRWSTISPKNSPWMRIAFTCSDTRWAAPAPGMPFGPRRSDSPRPSPARADCSLGRIPRSSSTCPSGLFTAEATQRCRRTLRGRSSRV